MRGEPAGTPRIPGRLRRLAATPGPRAGLAAVLALLLLPAPPAVFASQATPAPAAPRFAERAAALGLEFSHRHFGTGEKYMPENMAPGVAIFDYDGDGRLDVYLVQGAPIGPEVDPAAAPPEAANRLFRQTREGRFEDVTDRAGVGDRGYGMGAGFGDVDRDGDLDLYVTNFGPNVLYRNRGDGTFEDATAEAGVGCAAWSVGAGFFDPDADGDLDLFVVNYVDFAFDNHKWCGDARRGIRSYCHPDVYDGLADVFYRNEGDGKFTDVSRAAGLVASPADKGLGVAFSDLDGDGRLDAYVSNDSTMNYLYLGNGDGTFRESALLAGVGFNGSGAAEASMGIEIGDLDGDGRAELFVTHLDRETNTLYRTRGGGLYEDATEAAGLAAPSLPWVGFGTVFFDHDDDGDLDVFVANGHIIDNIELFDPTRSHRQPAQLFDNAGDGRFVEISGALGLSAPLVGRGAAAADLDRDGDADLVVAQNDGPALVLVNESGSAAGSALFRLAGGAGNPQGFGARLELAAGGRRQTRELLSASSYLSQGPPEIRFGLGGADAIDTLAVRWPTGRTVRYASLPAGRLYTLFE